MTITRIRFVAARLLWLPPVAARAQNVRIGTRGTPTSTLQVAGNNSGTLLTGDAYPRLNPQAGGDYYLLPSAASRVARVCYPRNNRSTNIAYVGTQGGFIFEGGGTAAADLPYFMQPSGLTKTVAVISDGTNCTLLKSGN